MSNPYLFFFFNVNIVDLEKEIATTPVFVPRKSRGQKRLVGYSPWDGRVGHDLVTKQQQLFQAWFLWGSMY